MTDCSLELKFILCYKYIYLQLKKISGETKLFITLFEIDQLVKFELSLI